MIKKIMFGLFVLSCLFLVFAIIVDSSEGSKLETSVNRIMDATLTGERISPADHIKEDQIHVYSDKFVIEIENARWARFTDTNSMDPTLDKNSNAIQIIPKSEDQIEIGDIISYDSKDKGIIIHRVIKIEEDEEGKYYIAKGDNNSKEDDEKIRFEQIRFITVGIIY